MNILFLFICKSKEDLLSYGHVTKVTQTKKPYFRMVFLFEYFKLAMTYSPS